MDFETSTMAAEYWHGKFCYEKSEIEDKKEFPLTEEGREAMRNWLLAHRWFENHIEILLDFLLTIW